MVASASPERFLQVYDGRVETRPIKGTARRVADPAEDARIAEALLASEKDRAENVMIVDLLRNDLSRVCQPHTVHVPALCGLESYAGLHHIVSVVSGILEEGADIADLLRASFPGGSITGAPKIRAMEIITEIEGRGRGVYCGSIGYFSFDGSADTNIAIRTVTFRNGEATFNVGGGITALSEPPAEFDETLTKGARIFAAFAEDPAP
ncbi:Aminodeoxychorismate synthase component 1 [Methylobrevis pamukkalensis]|uniref:Aminodeoxychorismate synthase component 1 n=1 Tax=Methylobrevis pamukkalensis TaxID=1439726 RepID=A0A1E3H3F0_9HYPH|nr:Aminodeoxychorismate synthase component 1 [Methylobrevis pamukkalensis]